VYPSELLDWGSLDGDTIRLGKVAQKHRNYHASMIVDTLMGANNLDMSAEIKDNKDPSNVLCLMLPRDVFYSF